ELVGDVEPCVVRGDRHTRIRLVSGRARGNVDVREPVVEVAIEFPGADVAVGGAGVPRIRDDDVAEEVHRHVWSMGGPTAPADHAAAVDVVLKSAGGIAGAVEVLPLDDEEILSSWGRGDTMLFPDDRELTRGIHGHSRMVAISGENAGVTD